jgi:CBS domain containing-hemolysin-like protein
MKSNNIENAANKASSNGIKTKKSSRKLSKSTIWTIKITIITLILSIVVSFITEITSSKSNVVVAVLVLLFLIMISIVFDTLGVAATSCDLAPLLSMASRKVKGAPQAVKLVKNAEKVSNICADVIGDMCGIISGSCSIAIVLMFAANNPNQYIFNIIMSSTVASVTVGGKAFFKTVAIKKSKELMLFAGRVISVFSRNK